VVKLQVREIAKSLTLGNQTVVDRLQRECESGTVPPQVFGMLLQYGYGKPLPMQPEAPGRRSLAFIDRAGLPWPRAATP